MLTHIFHKPLISLMPDMESLSKLKNFITEDRHPQISGFIGNIVSLQVRTRGYPLIDVLLCGVPFNPSYFNRVWAFGDGSAMKMLPKIAITVKPPINSNIPPFN